MKSELGSPEHQEEAERAEELARPRPSSPRPARSAAPRAFRTAAPRRAGASSRIGTMKSVKIQKNVLVNISDRNRSCGAPGRGQEHDDAREDAAVQEHVGREDHVGQRRQEVRPPLPADDREELPHDGASASAAGAGSAAGGAAGAASSWRVSRTKTSSSGQRLAGELAQDPAASRRRDGRRPRAGPRPAGRSAAPASPRGLLDLDRGDARQRRERRRAPRRCPRTPTRTIGRARRACRAAPRACPRPRCGRGR